MAYNNPNDRPARRTTGGDWWEDSGHRESERQARGQHISGDNNYGIDNDRDYRFREQYWGPDMPPHYPSQTRPVNSAFGTRMGNFGQIVYDPGYGIDSFGYHNDVPRRYGHMEDMPSNTDYTPSHRGRGPKNYIRSDERISEDINDRLQDDPYVDASDIEVRISNCEVILSGTVDNRVAKRRAADIAEEVRGVRHVENRIRVKNDRDEDNQQYNYPTATTTGGAVNTDSKAERKREKDK